MKRIRPLFAFVCLLLLPLLGRTQEYHVSGRVVDAITKEPIPFASLALREANAGALTNESGYFQLRERSEIRHDSLVFMAFGYVRRALLVEQGNSENLRIELSPRSPRLIISDSFKPCISVGKVASTAKDEVITGLPGSQYAFLIENDKRKQVRKMRSVSFYIGENGLPMAPFRIHLYRIDADNRIPAADLLTERVVLIPSKSGQWFTSDLSRYHIAIPKEGYFVALEFEKPANQLPQPNSDNYLPAGQIMRPAFDFKKSRLWSYSSEKGWTLLPQSNSSRRYNAMVKLEVEATD